MAEKSNKNDSSKRAVANSDLIDAIDDGKAAVDTMLLNLQTVEKETLASESRIKKARELYNDEWFKQQEAHIKATVADKTLAEKQLANLRKKQEQDVVNFAKQLEDNFYKFASISGKKQIIAERKETALSYKQQLQNEIALVAASKKNGNSKNAEQKRLRQAMIKAGEEAVELERRQRALSIAALKDKRQNSIITGDALESQLNTIKESYAIERQQHEENISSIDEQIAALEEKKKSGKLKDGGTVDKEIKELKGKKDEEKKALKQADKERFQGELLANTMKAGFKGMENAVGKLGAAFDKAMDTAIDTVGQYKSVLDARLQGTQSSYDDVASTIKKALAISPYVKQTEVLKKLNDAVDRGIAYNVEQRAFLATMTDKIVATFDAFDSNLMRIIRLQQADTTSARMGMEAELLQFFNQTFSDNSYLKEGYDDVSKALVDANAQMTRDMSISFEFNVQKWMGSLASLGFSTETISTIAQGINYLGSGNVAALAGNTQLQSLLAMSASRAGLSYSDLLVKGIDDSSVNILLKSMVEYLAEIAEDDNAVVKAAYGDVFNFTQSDLRAIKNLTNDEGATLSNIYNQSMTYSKAVAETQAQLNQIGSRLSMNEMINNVFDNFLYSAGESLASNPVSAIMWKTLSALEEVTGGIDLPFVNVMGFGLDLNMSVESLLKTGMFGLSALSQVGNMVTSIANGGGMDLGIWGGTEYTSRGGSYESPVGGVQSTKSGSISVTSGASGDTKKQALSETEEDQESQKKASKESMKDEITLETLYKELFERKTAVYTIDNPVKNKMSEVITAVDNVKTKANDIYNLLKKNDSKHPMYVEVTKMPSMSLGDDFKPKSSIGIDNSSVTAIADAIALKLLGDGVLNSDGVATLSDIADILVNGTISVVDRATYEEMTQLRRDLY